MTAAGAARLRRDATPGEVIARLDKTTAPEASRDPEGFQRQARQSALAPCVTAPAPTNS
jgi:hypothetical protein